MTKRKADRDEQLFNVYSFKSQRTSPNKKSCLFCREKKIKCEISSDALDQRSCEQCKTRRLKCSLKEQTEHSQATTPSELRSPIGLDSLTSVVNNPTQYGTQPFDFLGSLDWINMLDEDIVSSEFPLSSLSINQNPGSNSQQYESSDQTNDGVPIDRRNGETSFTYYGFSGEYDPFLRFNYYRYDTNDECFFSQKFFRKLGTQDRPAIFSFKDKELLLEQTKEFSTPRFDTKRVGELCKHVPNLTVLYLKFAFPFLPILDGNFLRKIFSNETIDFTEGNGELSPLFILLLSKVAKTWEHHDTSISVFFDDRKLILNNRNDLFTVLWNLLQDDLHTPDLTTVRSLILFFQVICFKRDSQTNSFERSLLSTLVSVCHTLGLHVDCSDWNIPLNEKIMRKRLWWTVFIMEKWNSFVWGSPSLLNENGYNVEIPSDTDDLFEDVGQFFTDKKSKSLFSNMLHLTFMLDSVNNKFFSLRSVMNIGKLQEIDRIEEQLKEWHNDFKEIEIDASITFQSVSVSYFVLRMVLFRARFQILGVNEFQETCFTSAKALLAQTVKFLGSLPSSAVNGFWYNWSRSLFMYIKDFSLLLLVISSSKEQSLEVLNIIKRFREWLEMNAKSLCILWTTLLRINTATLSIGVQFKNSLKKK